MKTLHAIYERGVFCPLEAVDLLEATEVFLEFRPMVPSALADHAEPMAV